MRADGEGRTWLGVGMVGLCALALAGCGSARFGGPGVAVASARPAPAARIVEPEVTAVPSGSVSSEPLPPPGGFAPGSNASPPPYSGSGPVLADVPVMPGSPGPIETMAPGSAAAAATPTRSASVGGYTARDATGATCRVNLSSAPALDLYKASAANCANKDLAKVTAWDFRDGEVYLYQPGGSVAARLRGSGGQLSGVLSKSGAPLTMAR